MSKSELPKKQKINYYGDMLDLYKFLPKGVYKLFDTVSIENKEGTEEMRRYLRSYYKHCKMFINKKIGQNVFYIPLKSKKEEKKNENTETE